MPDISNEIKAFKEAVHGEDVRSGLVSVANKVNDIANDMETKRNSGYFKGAKGDKGNKGDKGDPAATITVNEVITGAPGTRAEVTNVGTASDVKLNFKIPRGADGSSAAYQLPVATASAIGGVKSGGGIAVDATGNVTLNTSVINTLINTAITAYAQKEHPVGDVLITYNNVNPAARLGFGTWTLFGQGKTLMGVNTSDTDFNAAGKTGGEKKHLLTKDETPSPMGTQVEKVASTGEWVSDTSLNETAAKGHNNLPPYICVYFWWRTA